MHKHKQAELVTSHCSQMMVIYANVCRNASEGTLEAMSKYNRPVPKRNKAQWSSICVYDS